MRTRARGSAGVPVRRARLVARRGAVTVMAGVFMVMMTMFAGVAIDATRLYSERSQLQTAVDAAALAGADQMLRDSSSALDSATIYLQRNGATTTSPLNPDVITTTLGVYTPATGFIAGASPEDAIRTRLQRTVPFLLAQMFGTTGIQVSASATAWSSAPVQSSNQCMKPIMLPMDYLRRVLDPPSSDILPEDMRRLRELSQAERTDSFAIATPGSDLSTRYLQVTLPPFRRADGRPAEASQGDYYEYLSQCKTTQVAPDDRLLIQPRSNAAQSTVEGIRRICEADVVDGGLGGRLVQGSCKVNGNVVGVPIKVAFWDDTPILSTLGYGSVQVKMIGSYTVTHVNEHGIDPVTGEDDHDNGGGNDGRFGFRGSITGYLSLQRDFGPVNNSAASALRRAILVQ